MFLGRQSELAFLEKLYNSNELHCVCLNGAAGIGKTSLLQELGKRRSKAYFCVRSCTENANKAAFLAEMAVQGIVDSKVCMSWQDALNAIIKKACGEKMLLMIDDAQELGDSFHELLSALLTLVQKEASRLRLLIIFSGRRLDFLQNSLRKVGLKADFLTLDYLSYEECVSCFSAFNNDEKVMLYGITGGAPQYLCYIDAAMSFKENLYKLFYAPDACLLREGEKRLGQEFRQPHIYHAVLCSVACGAVHMKDIAEAVGMSMNKVSKYIGVLLKAGFLQRLVPIDEVALAKQHKNTCYVLTDTMLSFWYQFVYPYLGSIAMGAGKLLLRTKVLAALETYARLVFLNICYQHCFLLRERKNFAFDFTAAGFLWPKGDSSLEQLRLAAYDKNNACFMQSLWTKGKVDIDVIKMLQANYADDSGKNNYYLLFSRRGFTDRALSYAAKTQNIRLISLFYLR
ncbi:AAA family ATPase [uncultured Phascolarctobacterium sp.]|uniref:ATP-binding protein n=1 Tax=uncultured Phascolarctobacterium sp. TaxID=512296 RepID=UPI0025FBA833|nr:AAA family ATPase [uncultured Phascolarctobacterium sp.]